MQAATRVGRALLPANSVVGYVLRPAQHRRHKDALRVCCQEDAKLSAECQNGVNFCVGIQASFAANRAVGSVLAAERLAPSGKFPQLAAQNFARRRLRHGIHKSDFSRLLVVREPVGNEGA